MPRRSVALVALAAAILAVALIWHRQRAPTQRAPVAAARPLRPAAGAATGAEAGRSWPRWFAEPGAPSRRIAGRVIFGGEPVAGATVRLESFLTRLGLAPVVEIVTAADGRFDLGAHVVSYYVVSAVAPGKAAAIAHVNLRDRRARPDELELVLGACDSTFAGTVRDASGGVVRQARVELITAPSVGVETDDAGAFQLCLPREIWALVVKADGYGSVLLRFDGGGFLRRDVVLVPEAIVSGTVLRAEDDVAIPGARVSLSPAQRGDESGSSDLALSDEQGRFRIAGLSPGRYFATAVSDDRSETQVQLQVEAGETTQGVVIRLKAASRVRGRVVEAGRPVPGATVRLGGASAIAEDDGSFLLTGVARGESTVEVSHHEVLEPKGLAVTSPEHDGVVVEVAPMAAIRGRVVRDGKPVAGARVACMAMDGDSFGNDLSLADGSFECRGLEPGSFRVRATNSATQTESPEIKLVLAPREVKEGVLLELSAGATIAGVVVDQRGRPVAGVYVRFLAVPGYRSYWSDRTGVDGSFRAGDLAGEHTYTITVATNEMWGVTLEPVGPWKKVRLPELSSRVEGLRLAVKYEVLTIIGRVVDSAGALVPDVRVTAAAMRAGQAPFNFSLWPSATTGLEGRFVIENVVRGEHGLRATGPGGTEATVLGVAAGARDVTLTLVSPGRIDGTLVGFRETPRVYVKMEGRLLSAEVKGGRFTFERVPPGRYLVAAEASGEGDSAEVEVAPGTAAPVTLTTRGSARIVGQVIERPGGMPVPGMRCSAAVRGTSLSSRERATIPVDDRGRFELDNVPAGDLWVLCLPEEPEESSHSEGTVAVTAARGQEVAIEVPVVRGRPTDRRGWIGLGFHSWPEVRVGSVVPGSPAARAGFLVGDTFVTVDGLPAADLTASGIVILLADHDPGTKVSVTVLRAGQPRRLTLVVGAPSEP